MPPISDDTESVISANRTAFADAFASGHMTKRNVARHQSAIKDIATPRDHVIIIDPKCLNKPGAFRHTTQHGRIT